MADTVPIQHIILDDSNPLHRELSICRSGTIGMVRLADAEYTVYATLEISAHDYAALFHYGIIEALNALPFISETSRGLDSWDEAFLASMSIASMDKVLEPFIGSLASREPERILLGWQDDPVKIGYWRHIDPGQTMAFLLRLKEFAAEAARSGFDLEFIL